MNFSNLARPLMSEQAERAIARRGFRYNLEDKLGSGAFGVVMAATMREANIAAKYCDTTRFLSQRDPYGFMALMHEKWVLATVRHANIVRVYHIFIDMDNDGHDHRVLVFFERLTCCK